MKHNIHCPDSSTYGDRTHSCRILRIARVAAVIFTDTSQTLRCLLQSTAKRDHTFSPRQTSCYPRRPPLTRGSETLRRGWNVFIIPDRWCFVVGTKSGWPGCAAMLVCLCHGLLQVSLATGGRFGPDCATLSDFLHVTNRRLILRVLRRRTSYMLRRFAKTYHGRATSDIANRSISLCCFDAVLLMLKVHAQR